MLVAIPFLCFEFGVEARLDVAEIGVESQNESAILILSEGLGIARVGLVDLAWKVGPEFEQSGAWIVVQLALASLEMSRICGCIAAEG